MSTTDDLTKTERLDLRVEALSGVATTDHVEALREERARLAGDAPADDRDDGTDTDVDVVEALGHYDEDTLGSEDAIDAEVEALTEKLDHIGSVLPASRVEALTDRIEALEAAREVTSPYRTNTAEALAARIEVRG